MEPVQPSIREFYAGRKIFITGGSGFMGKVLVEKLLRSCPEVDTIYLLLRSKKGQPNAASRLAGITQTSLFDSVRTKRPDAISKLTAVTGDLGHLGLGLSEHDRRMLQANVSVIFHAAASVRFHDPLREAVLINVRGTRDVLQLALGMPQLKVFFHLSTAFSNCNRTHVMEIIYPAPSGWDWKTAIQLAERENFDSLLRILTSKILGPLIPNCYVFAKALGEQLVNEYRHRLPLVLCRPSIVVGAFDEPLPGWVDNMNGPYALWIGVYTGVVRTTFGEGSVCLDLVPVDVAVKSIIYLAWHRALETGSNSEGSHLAVYNCCSMTEPMSQSEFIGRMGAVSQNFPTTQMIWHPKVVLTSSWPGFVVNLLLFHLPYGLVLDAIRRRQHLKPMFVKAYRRLLIVSRDTSSFTKVSYSFDNSEFVRAADRMLATDAKDFSYSEVRQFDARALQTIVLGGRRHLLHESLETMGDARRRIGRLCWLDRFVKGLCWLTIVWALAASGAGRSTLNACVPRWLSALF